VVAEVQVAYGELHWTQVPLFKKNPGLQTSPEVELVQVEKFAGHWLHTPDCKTYPFMQESGVTTKGQLAVLAWQG